MKLLANNKKAYHEYFILEKLEAGLVLAGSEVKSMREGKVNIKEAYIEIREMEAYVVGMHVSPYEQAGPFQPGPVRDRKLLLHRKQIMKLYEEVKQQGVTLIPLRVYVAPNGHLKLEIGLAKGKKLYDKRASEKEREVKRMLERVK